MRMKRTAANNCTLLVISRENHTNLSSAAGNNCTLLVISCQNPANLASNFLSTPNVGWMILQPPTYACRRGSYSGSYFSGSYHRLSYSTVLRTCCKKHIHILYQVIKYCTVLVIVQPQYSHCTLRNLRTVQYSTVQYGTVHSSTVPGES